MKAGGAGPINDESPVGHLIFGSGVHHNAAAERDLEGICFDCFRDFILKEVFRRHYNKVLFVEVEVLPHQGVNCHLSQCAIQDSWKARQVRSLAAEGMGGRKEGGWEWGEDGE